MNDSTALVLATGLFAAAMVIIGILFRARLLRPTPEPIEAPPMMAKQDCERHEAILTNHAEAITALRESAAVASEDRRNLNRRMTRLEESVGGSLTRIESKVDQIIRSRDSPNGRSA